MRFILCVWLFAFWCISFSSSGQSPTGTIQGRVFDLANLNRLEGAEIFLLNTDPLLGAVTDQYGDFILSNVPVGRYVMEVKFLGYQSQFEELLIEAGKITQLDLGVQAKAQELEEVVVVSQSFLSSFDYLNNRSVTIDQTRRIAANFFDPARVAYGFPGVAVQNDQNNNIIVNGKSPNGILWRVNGLDVLNPNHLANAGTLSDRPTQNGGGVNILSAQVLGQTDFIGLSGQSKYGNATSGVVDMSFREGNRREREYAIQAGLLGIDMATEGPIKRGRSSYLVNYRYSTVGLLSALGVDFGDEEIQFQDLSFHVTTDLGKSGKLSVFGFGGLSNNDFDGIDSPGEWEFDEDSTQVYYDGEMFTAGLTIEQPLSKSGILSFNTALSIRSDERLSNQLTRDLTPIFAESYQRESRLWSSSISYNWNLSPGCEFSAGFMLNAYSEDVLASEEYTGRGELINGDFNNFLYQPYINFDQRLGNRVKMNLGLRYAYFDLNNTSSWQPRVNISYAIRPNASLLVNYGLQSQLQTPDVYLSANNISLDMNKTHHIGIGFQGLIGSALLKSEMFYEHLYDIPVQSDQQSSISLINGLNDLITVPLVNDGTGDIAGLNVSLEKPSVDGLYYMISAGIYQSEYEGSDGIVRDSEYNSQYTFSALGGKEFVKEKKDGIRTFGVDGRFIYSGGLRTSGVLEQTSIEAQRTIYDNLNAFTGQLSDYTRFDVRLSWRKEKQVHTRVISLDIQNLFSIENDAYQYYDFRQSRIVTETQLGIIPVLSYRIMF